MQYVIVNDEGCLYAGFETERARPVWRRTKVRECLIDEGIVDTVISQLKQLGFTKVAKREAEGVVRKWVPEDLDATELPRDRR